MTLALRRPLPRLVLLVALPLFVALGCASDKGNTSAKEVGKDAGSATRSVGEAAKDVGHGFKEVGTDIGHAFRDFGRGFKEGVKKETGDDKAE